MSVFLCPQSGRTSDADNSYDSYIFMQQHVEICKKVEQIVELLGAPNVSDTYAMHAVQRLSLAASDRALRPDM